MIQFTQRQNGKYGRIVDGDVSLVRKLEGHYTLMSAINQARHDGAGKILTYTDQAEMERQGGKAVSHAWSDGGRCYAFGNEYE